ncbi:MAG: hypothetical protein QHC78_20550 [Pigmentiphaga sp.]|uniref:hypothetical protein n=1 Tax=Pigmentiphaga sp. TaxID=1977564 RepID=UPI0029BBAAA8|nr:hypothetical protein [Pigmentiphaga sp.]MDX3908085.1 hypothetical protein [Pigmentiphaga sp.]
MSYTVILHDYPGLSELARITAEQRYQQALEHALGGPGGVLLAWKAWQKAEHAAGKDFPLAEWHIARRWVLAADRARAAGLGNLQDCPDAAFELRPL